MVIAMQCRLDDYAGRVGWSCTHADTIHTPEKLDARKPLWRKAFPFFPEGITSTPTKAMDIYSVGCMNIQNGLISINRYAWNV